MVIHLLVSRKYEGMKIKAKFSIAGQKICIKINAFFACVKGVKPALKHDLTEP